MPIELTKAQSDAVNFDGNILVAAAAGSGKLRCWLKGLLKNFVTVKILSVPTDFLL